LAEQLKVLLKNKLEAAAKQDSLNREEDPYDTPKKKQQKKLFTPVRKLQEITGVTLSDKQAEVLVDKYSSQAVLLQNGNLPKSVADKLVMQIQNTIRTTTNLRIDSHGFRFNGILSGALGQASNCICTAFKGSTVYCAKIGKAATIQREVKVASDVKTTLTSPTSLMPIIDDFPIDKERHCMISPLYGMPLSTLVALHPQGIKDPSLIKNILSSLLEAIKCFQTAGYCHGDIKPANIMTCTFGYDGRVVLIDYGSAVLYGEMILSYTAPYTLDVEAEGSLHFDFTCLASTIYQVCMGSLPNADNLFSVAELREVFLDGDFPQKKALLLLLESDATVDGVISKLE